MRQPREFFSLSFQNQDIFYAELESQPDTGAWLGKLGIVERCLSDLKHPEKVIIHLEDSRLEPSSLAKLADTIAERNQVFSKLAFVGIHGLAKFRLVRQLRKRKLRPNLFWKITDDLQYAKEWLVSPNRK